MYHGDGSWSKGDGRFSYGEIEKKRKERVDDLAYRLLAERERTNRDIEEELRRLVHQERALEPSTKEEAVRMEEVEETQSCMVDISNGSEGDTKVREADGDPTALCPTNVFFSKEFVSRFVLSQAYVSIEEKIRREKLVLPRAVQVQTKIQINKRLTQVSGRAGQVDLVFRALEQYSHTYVFVETFTLKMIEQGKLQVSSCPGSYREFAELFCRFYSPELMEYFRVILFTKEASTSTVRGIYSIYFGILEIQENSDEAWFFIASMLNSAQNELSCYVVESFFSILGRLLFGICRGPFLRLVEYAKKHYLREMSNEPCKTRLLALFEIYET